MRLLSKRQLKELVLYSPQHVQRLEDAGTFPKRVRLYAMLNQTIRGFKFASDALDRPGSDLECSGDLAQSWSVACRQGFANSGLCLGIYAWSPEWSAALGAIGTNTIRPETAERFRQELAARGLDASETLAKHGVGQQATSDPSNTPKEPQRMAPDIGATGLPRLTGEQTEQAAATLRRFWTGDPAVLEAALKNAGAAPVEQSAPDSRTEQEKEFDASNLAAVQPSEYQLAGLWVGRRATDAQGYLAADVPALERSIRGAMAELQVPAALGATFADDMLTSRGKWSELSEAGDPVSIQRHHLEQSALFAKVAKVGWQEAASQMKPWLATMSADTREFLARSSALESAPSRVRLWQAFQLSQARAKMGGKS